MNQPGVNCDEESALADFIQQADAEADGCGTLAKQLQDLYSSLRKQIEENGRHDPKCLVTEREVAKEIYELDKLLRNTGFALAIQCQVLWVRSKIGPNRLVRAMLSISIVLLLTAIVYLFGCYVEWQKRFLPNDDSFRLIPGPKLFDRISWIFSVVFPTSVYSFFFATISICIFNWPSDNSVRQAIIQLSCQARNLKGRCAQATSKLELPNCDEMKVKIIEQEHQ